jgi:type I restriction enzyme M protein
LKKWDENEKPLEDYDIFMGVSEKAGKDTSGNYVYKKDKDGKYMEDDEGNRIINHDLDEIAGVNVKCCV